MRYENLIFDLYGTLVDIHTADDSPAVWRKTALYFQFYGAAYTPVELKSAYAAQLMARQAQAGQSYECFPEIPIEEVFAALFAAKGVSDAAQRGENAAQLYRILSIRRLRLYPGVKNALETLRRQGHKLWLLSNAQRVFTAYELEALGLTDLFDGIYISSDYRCRKPDVRFFRTLLQERQLPEESCLMIGNDLTTDIGGAQAAGLDTLYLHSNISPAADEAPSPDMPVPTWRTEGADWRQILPMLENLCDA